MKLRREGSQVSLPVRGETVVSLPGSREERSEDVGDGDDQTDFPIA